MKVIGLTQAAFVLEWSIITHTLLQNKIHTMHNTKIREDIFQDTNFWSTCSYHYNSTRILTVLVAPYSGTLWNNTVSDLIHSELNIAVIIIEKESEYFGSTTLPHGEVSGSSGGLIPPHIREYPVESAHSYMIISYSAQNALSYTRDTTYPQNKWTPKDNYLVLIMLHKSWHSCTNQQTSEYVDIFSGLWTERNILNVITIVKCLESGLKQSDIMVYDPFDVKIWPHIIKVKPDQVAELPRS
jgi:hypothetical protein